MAGKSYVALERVLEWCGYLEDGYGGNQMGTKSQKEMILEMLKAGNEVTPATVIEQVGCYRLAARISELRETHNIETEMVSAVNRWGIKVEYASYKLASSEPVQLDLI